VRPEVQVPAALARALAALDDHARASDPAATWGAQFDLGLAWVDAPMGRGGLGSPAHLQLVVEQRLAELGVPSSRDANFIGVEMAARTVLAHGTDEQVARWLRPLFVADELWCQLFSEPGAGSDLAAVATRATPDGDRWRIDGQKVWTTNAHLARWGLLLARSDPAAPKHRGLTFFVCDLRADTAGAQQREHTEAPPMTPLSESLEALATRVKGLEDSATATFEADRARLEARRREIDEAFRRNAGELEAAVHKAAATGRSWWNETKASVSRPLHEVRARYEERQSEHELRRAIRLADASEEDAAAAIEVAAYCLNVAELAVIDAALARMAADQLAGYPTGIDSRTTEEVSS
jgi:hypothetical protein